MEKSKLAIITDEILRGAGIWLMSAICIRYAIKELYLIILLATAITMLITILIRRYYEKKNLTAKALKETDSAMCELLIADRASLLEKIGHNVGGTVEHDAVITDNTVIYPYFYGKLPVYDLNKAYNLTLGLNKKLLVLCAETSTEVNNSLELFSEIPIAILTKNKSFEFLRKYELLPQVKNRKKRKISLIKSAIKKSKIKGYLLAALILLLTAAFSPYSLLCIIAAAINITMSILCEVKGS